MGKEISLNPVPLGIPLRQEPLNFDYHELEPFMNARVLQQHYEVHHADYLKELQDTLASEEIVVGNVLSLMPGMHELLQPPQSNSRMPIWTLASQGRSFQPLQTLSPKTVEIIRRAGGAHVNHTAFWRFLSPPNSGPTGPQGRVSRAIQEDFGSIKAFRELFKELAMKRTGSGWAWLVYRPDGCLVVTTTPNEDNPMMKEHIPWYESGRAVLALDLWEHSYCDQYHEDREQYIDAWWKVVNWNFVSRAYGIVSGKI